MATSTIIVIIAVAINTIALMVFIALTIYVDKKIDKEIKKIAELMVEINKEKEKLSKQIKNIKEYKKNIKDN